MLKINDTIKYYVGLFDEEKGTIQKIGKYQNGEKKYTIINENGYTVVVPEHWVIQ